VGTSFKGTGRVIPGACDADHVVVRWRPVRTTAGHVPVRPQPETPHRRRGPRREDSRRLFVDNPEFYFFASARIASITGEKKKLLRGWRDSKQAHHSKQHQERRAHRGGGGSLGPAARVQEQREREARAAWGGCGEDSEAAGQARRRRHDGGSGTAGARDGHRQRACGAEAARC